MFLCLFFAIWLSLVLVGPTVIGWFLSLLWAWKPVSAPLCDQLSPGTVCFGAPSYWVQVEPGLTLSQLLCCSCVPCAPGCTCQLSCQREDRGRLTFKVAFQISPCWVVLPWQDQWTEYCGVTQLLGACVAWMDPAALLLLFPVLLAVPTSSFARKKLAMSSPPKMGVISLPAERFSTGRIGAQTTVSLPNSQRSFNVAMSYTLLCQFQWRKLFSKLYHVYICQK